MPATATIMIAKLILILSRLFGRGGGSALPGLVAERIDPHIGRKLALRLPHGSIVVTGTNGKTTTTKMLAGILENAGERLVTNRTGSNLSRGIVSTMIEHISLSGNFSQTLGLFEVDEAAMAAVCEMVQPRSILVLNLFRDQLDRYGELNTTAQLIGAGISKSQARLYLNADDPLVADLARYGDPEQVTYFGVGDVPGKRLAHDITADSYNCPVCGEALTYSANYFGHIGHYDCKRGHFDRPQPLFEATDVKLTESGVSFTTVDEHRQPVMVGLQLPGLYNVYNGIAAYAVAAGVGVGSSHIVQSLEHTEAAFGRVERFEHEGRAFYLLLVKNPTGFNQVLQTFLLNKKQQNVLFIINDNFADGRDVSWVWDVAFEELTDSQHTVSTAGIRSADMTLRLKYANIPVQYEVSDVKKAVNQFVAQIPQDGIGYIIPTYTAMLEARQVIGRLTKVRRFWK